MRLTQYEHETFAHHGPLADVGGLGVDAAPEGTGLPDPSLWPGPQPLPGTQPYYSAILINDALGLSPNVQSQDDDALQSTLHTAMGAVAQQLRGLAGDARGFELLLQQLYGAALDRSAGEALRGSILAGDFSWTPSVQLASSTELGGSTLRFDAGRHTVLLNRDVLRNGAAQAEQALMGCLPDVLRARLTTSSPSPAPAPAPGPAPSPAAVVVATPAVPGPAASDSTALNTVLNAVAQQLQDLARDAQGFSVLLDQLYGTALNRQAGDDFRRSLLAGDFRWAPDVRVVSAAELGGAAVRVDAGTGSVQLSREVLHNDPDQAQQALLSLLPDVLRGRLTVSGPGQASAPSPAPAQQQTGASAPDVSAQDNALLEDSLKAVAQWLTTFAGDATGFVRRLEQLYGNSLNTQAAETRRQSILAGDFSWTPTVRLASHPELGSSAVRYDASSHTLLLSVDLLRRSPLEAQQALLDSLPDILRGQLTSSSSGSSATQGQHTSQGMAQSNTATTTSQATQTRNDTGVSDRSGQGASTIVGPQPSANQITGLPPTVLLLDPAHATIALEHGAVVSPLWMEQRAVVLDAIGTFIHQSFQHALTQGPGALGWRTFEPHWRDGPNGPERDPIGPQGQVLKWVPAAPSHLSSSAQSAADRQDGELLAPQGQWWGFCHDTFKQQLQAVVVAEPSPALLQLGTLYGVSAENVFQQHPELWDLAQKSDRSLNAGPPPVAGAAMGDVTQLGMLDLHLRDPLNQQLIQAFGGTVAEPTSSQALEQIRLYGRDRWEQLTRLDNALAMVRDTFTNDMAQARASNGPGWVDVPMQTGTDPQTGQPVGIYQLDAEGTALRDSQGQPLLATTRVFNPEVFAKQWLAQGGFVQEAFRTLFGEVSTQIVRTEQMAGEGSSETVWVAHNTLSRSPYQLTEHGLRHVALTQVDLNAPPALKDSRLIFFDSEAGWVTPHDNVPRSRSGLEQVMDVAAPIFIGAMMVVAASPLIAWAGGPATVGGAFIVGSASAIGTSLGSTGTVRLKDVFRGGMASVLSLGLNNLVSAQFNIDLQALSHSAQLGDRLLGTFADATIRGAVQTLMGGEFEEGFKAGLASGLAKEVLRGLHLAIDQNPHLSPSEAQTLRFVARIASSAVAALANPEDPLHAFAADFVGGLMSVVTEQALADHMQPPPTSTGFPLDQPVLDAAGRPVVGAVDPTLPPVMQAKQLADSLVARGASPDEAARQAVRAIGLQTLIPAGGPTTATSDSTGEVVTVLGQGLPRDELGNLYDLDASGRTIVYLAGGGMVSLSPGTAVPVSSGLVVGGHSLLSQLAEATRTFTTIARAATPPMLLLSSLASVNETSPFSIELNAHTRFVQQPSEAYGRVYDLDESTGEWAVRTQHVVLSDGQQIDQPVLYVGMRTPTGFSILTEDELSRLRQPITTPIALPPPPIPPRLGTGHESLIIPGSVPDVRAQIDSSPPGTAAHPQRLDELIITSRGFEPGSTEHKAATWAHYVERGGNWDYDRWSTVYENNQTRAAEANAATDTYHQTLGWGAREVTIHLDVAGESTSRRLDIADAATRRAIEYKTGYQTATAENLWEIARDAELVGLGWDVQWVFRDRPSQPLLHALERAGIRFKVGN